MAVGTESDLAGKSTLCEMEQQVGRQSVVKVHELLWHHFIEQHETPPREIELDFNGTDTPVHGDPPSKFFNAYYDHHCYFPLYVFCGRHLLVNFIPQYWPDTRIVFRGDSGFYRLRLLSWWDRNNLDYLASFSRNSQLLKDVEAPSRLVRETHQKIGEKVSAVYWFRYQARSWEFPRWMMARLEEGEQGPNSCFVVSSPYDDGFKSSYQQYCA